MNSPGGAAKSPIDGVDPDVFRPRTSRGYAWRRRAAPLAAAVLVVAAVASGLVVARRPGPVVLDRCTGLGSGLYRIDGQCVGVTDGSAAFSSDRDLNQIEALIKKENARVAKQQGSAYVKIALLSPLTADTTSFMNHDQVLHALEGVYVAQLRANTSRSFRDPDAALIQVYLANEGSHQDQWGQVVAQLERMTGGDHPLVAVVGLGTSIPATKEAAHQLSNHVPMVGAVLSADELDGVHIPGLIRVSPSNSDYAESLRVYLQRDRPDLKKGILVYDRSMPDLYVSSLQSAYHDRLGGYMTFPDQGFKGKGNLVPGTAGLFKDITDEVCHDRVDLVLYAGRGLDLPGFIDSLAARKGCGTPVAILVGATGLSFGPTQVAELVDNHVTVIAATSTDPRWQTGEAVAPAHYDDFQHAFVKVDPSPHALDDSYAIMHHDALAAAVMAARRARSQGGALSTFDVEGELDNLSGDDAVPGASGTLVFSRKGGGNVGGKPVPIVEFPDTAIPAPPAAAPYVTVAG